MVLECSLEQWNEIFLYAGVAKHGQRRKIEGLVLSGPRVQISSPAYLY